MTGHKAEQKVGLKVPRLHFKLLNHYKYTQIDKQRENIVGGKREEQTNNKRNKGRNKERAIKTECMQSQY